MTMQSIFTRFIKDEEGATAIEYGIIAGLISLALIGSFTGVSAKLTQVFDAITNALPGAASTSK